MLYQASKGDIKKIKDVILKLIKENKFYFNYKDNGKDSYKIYNEDYIKEILNKGDVILLYEDKGEIIGISHWYTINSIYFNEYTGVLNQNSKKGVAKSFYSYFLNKDLPVGAEFIVYTDASSKIFEFWYNKGTKIYGFSPSQHYYNKNIYSTILGFRPSENKIKLKIPSYSEKFVKKMCILNNLDCKIEIKDFERHKNSYEKGLIYFTENFEYYEEKGHYLTGFMYDKEIVYYYSNKIDHNGIKNIERFFENFKTNNYFEEMANNIFSYIDIIKSL